MNSISGTISKITVAGQLSLVQVKVQQLLLSAIVIDTPKSATYLVQGTNIQLLFKETEVILATGDVSNISLQNKLAGTIQKIDTAPLLSKIEILTDVGTITSIITSNAVKQLELQEGSQVTAMVKTNEMMLAI